MRREQITALLLTVGVQQLMLRSMKRVGVPGQIAAIYSTFMHLEILQAHFNSTSTANTLWAHPRLSPERNT